MPLRPATNGTTSRPWPSSSARRLCASRSTLALKPPQKPRSLVRMSTAALVGFSGGRVSGWSTFPDLATTASTARVISRAYGWAACSRCCALMIREDAISSWARVILAVDWTLLIRRRTARSWAPILRYPALLCLGWRRRVLLDRLLLDILGRDGLSRRLGHQQFAAGLLETGPELLDGV